MQLWSLSHRHGMACPLKTQPLMRRVLCVHGEGGSAIDSWRRMSADQARAVQHVSMRDGRLTGPCSADSVWQRLSSLQAMHLISSQLDSLPPPCQLQQLVSLDLSHSTGLTELPSLQPMHSLQYLSLRFCFQLELRTALQLPAAVRVVDMCGCIRAQTRPNLPDLRVVNLNYCLGELILSSINPAAEYSCNTACCWSARWQNT